MAEGNIATDVRTPGVFQSFTTKGSAGLAPTERALAIVAAVPSGSGTATANEPTLTSGNDADDDFGQGSEAAVLARFAEEVFTFLGNRPKIVVVPVTEPSGDNAVHRVAFSGTATAASDMLLNVGRFTLAVAVSVGDDATAVAAAAKAKADTLLSDLAFVPSSSAGNLDFTATCQGVNGNDLLVTAGFLPAGLSATISNPTPGTGALAITDALANLVAADYQRVVISSSTATERELLETHVNDASSPTNKRFRRGIIGFRGTVGESTTLASGANDRRISIVGIPDSPNSAGEIAVAHAATFLDHERPGKNTNNKVVPLSAPAASSVPTGPEVETMIAGGVTPYKVNEAGDVYLVRAVTTKTTDGGARFENSLDEKNTDVPDYYARQLDIKLTAAMDEQNLDTELCEELRLIMIGVAKEGERLRDLHRVDDHLAEFKVVPHSQVPTRAVVTFPQSVTPSAHQADVDNVIYVEGAK